MSIVRNQFVSMTSDQIDLINREEKAIGQFFSKEKEFAEIFAGTKPLNPAALDGQDAPLTPEQSSVTDLPFVNQQTGD